MNIELNILNDNDTAVKLEIGEQAKNKRHKKNLYSRLPLFWRAFAFFLYRYILRFGFLEGKEGFCWHFFQGLWYRMFVDLKILEIKKTCGNDVKAIREYVSSHYNVSLE